MDDDAEREAVAIQLGWISDLLADTERLIASKRGYVRDLLESIDDDTCPFTFAELQGEIRDLHESRAVDAALEIKEMLDDVRAILARASSLHPPGSGGSEAPSLAWNTFHAQGMERGGGGGEGACFRVGCGSPSEEQEDVVMECVFALEMGFQPRRREEGKGGEWRG
uniref:Uncharacterized protein n=1 Tax=Oryza punctata TaxID=4537 RepID=A0A0E0L873_ORYPU|nr:hypothetical protein [Oryza punctata]